MPILGTGLLRHMVGSCGNHQILVPIHDDGLIEPLCGIYRKTIVPHMEKYIRNNKLSLYQFIQDNDSHFIKVGKEFPSYHNHMFENINTPEDLEKLMNHIE
jgi:molybdopterin-guanine dinucleotide biosynthesis protein A